MKRAQILLASGEDRLRWPHALLQEHLLAQLFAAARRRDDLPRGGGRARASPRRVEPAHRATPRDEPASRGRRERRGGHPARSRSPSSWGRTRDAPATLRDLALLDGRLEGSPLATHRRWRAEALRHAGRLEDCAARGRRSAAPVPRRERRRERSALPPTARPRRLRSRGARRTGGSSSRARSRCSRSSATTHGRASCEVTLGEIDYLLGDHARARRILDGAGEALPGRGRSARPRAVPHPAQRSSSSPAVHPTYARELLRTARADFDAIGYRLGMAQCDVALAHTDHREGRLEEARRVALSSRQSFRDLAQPARRGRLRAAALDGRARRRTARHGRVARARSDRPLRSALRSVGPGRDQDSCSRRSRSSVARSTSRALELVACESIALVEAEPKQHLALTRAWLAYHEGRFREAVAEIDLARQAFRDPVRTGDHTPELLRKFSKMGWPAPASEHIDAWLRALSTRTAVSS